MAVYLLDDLTFDADSLDRCRADLSLALLLLGMGREATSWKFFTSSLAFLKSDRVS